MMMMNHAVAMVAMVIVMMMVLQNGTEGFVALYGGYVRLWLPSR